MMKTPSTASLRIVDRAADHCQHYLAGHHLHNNPDEEEDHHSTAMNSSAAPRSAQQARWARSMGKQSSSGTSPPNQRQPPKQRSQSTQSAQRARWARSLAKFTETETKRNTQSSLSGESARESTSLPFSVETDAEALSQYDQRSSDSFGSTISSVTSKQSRWARSLAKFKDAHNHTNNTSSSTGEVSSTTPLSPAATTPTPPTTEKQHPKSRWARSLAKKFTSAARHSHDVDSPTTSSTDNTEDPQSSGDLAKEVDDVNMDEKTLIELAKLISMEEEEEEEEHDTTTPPNTIQGPQQQHNTTSGPSHLEVDETHDIALQTALLVSQQATHCQRTEEALVDIIKEASRQKHQHERRKERVVQEHVEYQDYVWERRRALQQVEEELVQDIMEQSIESFKVGENNCNGSDDDDDELEDPCSEELDIRYPAQETTTE